jgi:hypothetical protein
MLRAHGEVGEKRHTPGEWLASCSLHAKRYRNGEAIATGFVASTVHQVVRKRFCKRQQMPWSKRGAPPLLLQPRVKTLNRAWGTMCTRWYADMEVHENFRAGPHHARPVRAESVFFLSRNGGSPLRTLPSLEQDFRQAWSCGSSTPLAAVGLSEHDCRTIPTMDRRNVIQGVRCLW